MQYFSLLLITLLASFSCYGQVYTWINEHGVRVYGDKPPADAKKADLPKIQRLPDVKAPENEKKNKSANNGDANGFSGYTQIAILDPKEDQILNFDKAGNLNVQLQLQPALQIGHEVTLLLNGKPVQKGSSLQFELTNLDRGSYLIQALIKHQGRLLIKSPKRRIHVQRPSILNRPRT